ncbi:MAG: Ig-like domain-containing protein [Dactylosporangium sp.]|nr:hypothetical protein [Dactylosporangium sp.]NNJ59363.1 Ig-like domain-containing protein [Dactylosporangium sp.]
MQRFGALVVAGVASVGCSIVAMPSAVAATPDPQPPVVTLISPTPGETFSQSWEILLYARATDPDGTITKVEFYDGAKLLATDDTPGLYYFAIPPHAAALGAHTFVARAYDDQGLATTSTAVTVYVVPPTIMRIPGYVEAGVEAGCMILVPDVPSPASRPYLLLGGDRSVLVPGAHLLVSGELMPNVASYCMQGIPLRVISAEPL